MIDPARIKEPVIPQICSKLLSMLLLKIMVVLSTPLLVFHDSFYYLMMITTLQIQQRKIILTMAVQREDNDLGNMIKTDTTKRQVYIAPHALIKIRNFITVMIFKGLIQERVLTSWNINIVWNKDSVCCCVFILHILYFTCWTLFCACFAYVPLITHCSNPCVCWLVPDDTVHLSHNCY